MLSIACAIIVVCVSLPRVSLGFPAWQWGVDGLTEATVMTRYALAHPTAGRVREKVRIPWVLQVGVLVGIVQFFLKWGHCVKIYITH